MIKLGKDIIGLNYASKITNALMGTDVVWENLVIYLGKTSRQKDRRSQNIGIDFQNVDDYVFRNSKNIKYIIVNGKYILLKGDFYIMSGSIITDGAARNLIFNEVIPAGAKLEFVF